jgi:hypothetical protein
MPNHIQHSDNDYNYDGNNAKNIQVDHHHHHHQHGDDDDDDDFSDGN